MFPSTILSVLLCAVGVKLLPSHASILPTSLLCAFPRVFALAFTFARIPIPRSSTLASTLAFVKNKFVGEDDASAISSKSKVTF